MRTTLLMVALGLAAAALDAADSIWQEWECGDNEHVVLHHVTTAWFTGTPAPAPECP